MSRHPVRTLIVEGTQGLTHPPSRRGIAFSLVYFILLLLFARGAQWWRLVRLLALALGALAGIEAALVFALDVPTSTTATAVFAVLCNVAMFAGPITSVRAGLRLMDPSRLPVLLTVTGAACSMCWGAYGYLTTNPFIWVPNVCGILLNGGQLAGPAAPSSKLAGSGVQRNRRQRRLPAGRVGIYI